MAALADRAASGRALKAAVAGLTLAVAALDAAPARKSASPPPRPGRAVRRVKGTA
ncbi:MAG: hypothetical protein ACK40C_13730 [Novosphingobium meiothermophilum]